MFTTICMTWTYPVYTHEVVGKVNTFYYLNNSVFVFAITSILNMCYFSKRRVYTYKCNMLYKDERSKVLYIW